LRIYRNILVWVLRIAGVATLIAGAATAAELISTTLKFDGLVGLSEITFSVTSTLALPVLILAMAEMLALLNNNGNIR
jgi:hypothetical protein